MRLVIGIDPGITGAVGWMTAAEAHVDDMPTMAAGEARGSIRRQVNPAALASMLRNIMVPEGRDETMVVLERADGYIDNKAACFSMGNSYGCCRGVVAALGLSLVVTRAQDWKRHYHLSRDKDQARRRAIELYPTLELGLKKHHNRAEAILIARYGWEELR